jgi:hypothetical protein
MIKWRKDVIKMLNPPTHLKIIGAGTHPYPRGLEDWREYHGELDHVNFPRNKYPRFAPDTTLAIYLAGTLRIPALVTVKDGIVEPSEYPDQENQDRWPYMLRVESRFEIGRLSDAPKLEDVGIKNLSVRSQSHIGLSADQARAIQEAFVRAIGGSFRKATIVDFSTPA